MATLKHRLEIALGNTPKTLNQVIQQQEKIKKLIEEITSLQQKYAGQFEDGTIVQRNNYKITEEDLANLIKRQKELNTVIGNFGKAFSNSRGIINELKNIGSEIVKVNQQLAKSGNVESFSKLREELAKLKKDYEELSQTVRTTGPVSAPASTASTASTTTTPPSGGGGGGGGDVAPVPPELYKASIKALKEYRDSQKELRDDVDITSSAFKQYSDNIREVNQIIDVAEQQSKQFKEDVRGVGVEALDTSNSLTGYSQKMKELTTALRNAKIGTPEYDGIQEELAKTIAAYNQLKNKPKELAAEFELQNKVNSTVEDSTENLTLRIQQLKKQLEQTEIGTAEFNRLGNEIGELTGKTDNARLALQEFIQQGKLNERVINNEVGSINRLKAEIELLEIELKNLSPNDSRFESVSRQFSEAKAQLDTLRRSVNQSTEDFRLQAQALNAPTNSIQQLEAELKLLKRQLETVDVNTEAFQNIIEDVNRVETSLNRARASITEFSQTNIVTPTNLTEIDQYKARLQELRNSYQQLQLRQRELATTSFGREASNELRLMRAEADRLENEINQVETALRSAGASVPPLTRNLQQAGNAAGSVSNTFKTMTASLLTVFGTTELVSTLARGFREMIRVGAEFEAQMSSVAAISGATAEEYRRLTEESRRLGAQTSFTAQQAAEGAEILAVAGFSVTEILQAQEGVLRLAESAGVSLDKAADVAAITLRGYGLAATEIARVNDILTNSFTSANITLDSFNEANKLVAPIAKQVGLELEETAAIINTLGDAGFRGSIGGTALRAILVQLLKPSDKARKSLQDLGVQIIDDAGNLRNLVDILNDFNEKQITNEQLSRIFGKQVSAVSILLERQRQAAQGLTTSLETVAVSLGTVGTAARAIQDPFKAVAEANKNFLDSINRDIQFGNLTEELNAAYLSVKRFNITQEETKSLLDFMAAAGINSADSINILGTSFEKLTSPEILGRLDEDIAKKLVIEGSIQDVNRFAYEIQQLGLTAQDLDLNTEEFEQFKTVLEGAAIVSQFNIARLSDEVNRAVQENEKYNISIAETSAFLKVLGESGRDSREAVRDLGDILDGVFGNDALLNQMREVGGILSEDNRIIDTQAFINELSKIEGLTAESLGLSVEQFEAFNEILKLNDETAKETGISFRALKETIEEYSTTNDIAQKKLDNLSGNFKILVSATQDLAIEVFDKLSPAFRSLTGDATEFAGEIKQFAEGFGDLMLFVERNSGVFNALKTVILSVVGAIATLRIATIAYRIVAFPTLTAVQGFKQAFTAARFAIVAYRNGLVTARGAVQAFNAATAATPWGAIAAGIGLVIGLVISLASAFDEASDSQKRYNEAAEELANQNQEQLNKIKEDVDGVFDGGSIEQQQKAVEDLVNTYGEKIPELQKAIDVINTRDITPIEKEAELLNLMTTYTETLNKEESLRKQAVEETLIAKQAQLDLDKEIKLVADKEEEIKNIETTTELLKEQFDEYQAIFKASSSTREQAAEARKERDKILILLGQQKSRLIQANQAIEQSVEKQKELTQTIEESTKAAAKLGVELKEAAKSGQEARDVAIGQFQDPKELQALEQLSIRQRKFFDEQMAALKLRAEQAKNLGKTQEEFAKQEAITIGNNIANQTALEKKVNQAYTALTEQQEKALTAQIETLAKNLDESNDAIKREQERAQKDFERELERLRDQADKLIEARFKNTLTGIEQLRERLVRELVLDSKFALLTVEQQIALLDKIDGDMSKAREKLVEKDIERVVAETNKKIQIINTSYEREAAAIRKTYENRISLITEQLNTEIISQEEYTKKLGELNDQLSADLEAARERDLVGNEFVSETTIKLRRDQAETELEFARERAATEQQIAIKSRDEQIAIIQQQVAAQELAQDEATKKIEQIKRDSAVELVTIEEKLANELVQIEAEAVNEIAELRAGQTQGFNAALTLALAERRRILEDQLEVISLTRQKEIALAKGNGEQELEIERRYGEERLRLQREYFAEAFELRQKYAGTASSDFRIAFINANREYQLATIELKKLRDDDIISQEEYVTRSRELERELITNVSGLETERNVSLENALKTGNDIREQALIEDLKGLKDYRIQVEESDKEFYAKRLQLRQELEQELAGINIRAGGKDAEKINNQLTAILAEYDKFYADLRNSVQTGQVSISEANEQLAEKEKTIALQLRDLQASSFDGVNEQIAARLKERISLAEETVTTLRSISVEQVQEEEKLANSLERIRDRIRTTISISGGVLLNSTNDELKKLIQEQEDLLGDAVISLGASLDEGSKNFLQLFDVAVQSYEDQRETFNNLNLSNAQDYTTLYRGIVDSEINLQRGIFEARVDGLNKFTEAQKKALDESITNSKVYSQELEALARLQEQGQVNVYDKIRQKREQLNEELAKLRTFDLGIDNQAFQQSLETTLQTIESAYGRLEKSNETTAQGLNEIYTNANEINFILNDELETDNLVTQKGITQATKDAIEERLRLYGNYIENLLITSKGDITEVNLFEPIRSQSEDLQKDLAALFTFDGILNGNNFELPTEEIKVAFNGLLEELQKNIQSLDKTSADYGQRLQNVFIGFRDQVKLLEEEFQVTVFDIDAAQIEKTIYALAQAQLDFIGVGIDTIDKADEEIQVQARKILINATEELINNIGSQKDEINDAYDERRKEIIRNSVLEEETIRQTTTDRIQLSAELNALADRTNAQLSDVEVERINTLEDLSQRQISFIQQQYLQRRELALAQRKLEEDIVNNAGLADDEVKRRLGEIEKAYNDTVSALETDTLGLIDKTSSLLADVPEFKFTENFVEAKRAAEDYYGALEEELRAQFENQLLQVDEKEKFEKNIDELRKKRDASIAAGRQRATEAVIRNSEREVAAEVEAFAKKQEIRNLEQELISGAIADEEYRNAILRQIQAQRRKDELTHQQNLYEIELRSITDRLALLEKEDGYDKERQDLTEKANKLRQQLAKTQTDLDKQNANIFASQLDAERERISAQFRFIQQIVGGLESIYQELSESFKAVIQSNIDTIKDESSSRIEALRAAGEETDRTLEKQKSIRQQEIYFEVESETLRNGLLEQEDKRFTEEKAKQAAQREEAIRKEELARDEAVRKEEIRKQRLVAIEQTFDAIKQVIFAAEQVRNTILEAQQRRQALIAAQTASAEIAASLGVTLAKNNEAVAKSASLGVPAGIAAILAIITAISSGVIAVRNLTKSIRGETLTQFEEGGEVRDGSIRSGGRLVGRRHSSGGIRIEAEGGEYIVNREAYSMFPDLIQYLNEQGRRKMKGRPYELMLPEELLKQMMAGTRVPTPRIPRYLSRGIAAEGGQIIGGVDVSTKELENKMDSLIEETRLNTEAINSLELIIPMREMDEIRSKRLKVDKQAGL